MATYLKRTSKLFDISLAQTSVNISLRDLICPVCRSILIEPVTLPCTHNLCLKCLKGTFEHNSLSCPLCRVRVGSWLRTATKTETLVNNSLWDLIQTKFPKEVENKYNGDDRNIESDADFIGSNKILSAAGEIRREYEIQLQMAEEEIRSQRNAEQVASEALIQKIHEADHQQQLDQLNQDHLLAKSLVKKQIVEKRKEISKYSNSLNVSNNTFRASKLNVATMTDVNSCKIEPHSSEYERPPFLEPQGNSSLRRTNIGLISKIHADRCASTVKDTMDTSNDYSDLSKKFCCQKSIPVYNSIPKAPKRQTVAKIIESCISNCSLEPRMNVSKIYGIQSKEELHIPNDIINIKKKSLGVEVCISSGDDDERTGSAESAGSHDSINQEIHHFKPIKAMPRTPLKVSTDGRQIDPKLIRVMPILKRISNVVPKPPSHAHLKRIVGCSWSAFRGKTKQISKEKDMHQEQVEHKPSTSCNQLEFSHNRVTKFEDHDNVQKIDFVSKVSINSNVNHDKNVSTIMNGTKISKKEHRDIRGAQKSWKSHVRNGMVCKSRRQRTLWTKKEIQVVTNEKDNGTRNSISSTTMAKSNTRANEQSEIQDEDEVTIENIAERIKKRKLNTNKKDSSELTPVNSELQLIVQRNTRRRLCQKEDLDYHLTDDLSVAVQKSSRSKYTRTVLLKDVKQRIRPPKQLCAGNSEKCDTSGRLNYCASNRGLSKTTQKMRHTNSSKNQELNVTYENTQVENCSTSGSRREMQECTSENNNAYKADEFVEKDVLSDDEIIKEQDRMERLVIQEREDFELARRLQAKFDEMERIAGRTRRSKKAIESATVELDLYKIDIGKNVQRPMSSHATKTSIANRTINTEAKKRGRPPKRVK